MSGMLFYQEQLFVLLSLGVCVLGVYWLQRKHRQAEDSQVWGLGKGIVALLGQWIGLSVFLASSQASYELGINGLFGFCSTGMISFFIVYLLIKKENQAGFTNLEDKINDIYTGPSKNIMRSFVVLFWLESMITTVLAGKIVLHLLSGWRVMISLIVAILIFQMTLLFKRGSFYSASLVLVILAVTTAMLIPTLVYLKVSVPTVYSGVKFLATEMLQLDLTAGWVVGLALGIHFLAHSLLNRNIWKTYAQIKASKRAMSFLLSPILWVVTPLSIGTLSFVARAEAVWPTSPDEVSVLIVAHFGGQLGIVLLVICLILILLLTTSSFMVEAVGKSVKADFLLKLLTVLAAGVIVLQHPDLTILDNMLYFALIYAALVPVYLLTPRMPGSQLMSLFTLVLGISAGAYGAVHWSIQYGIFISLAVTITIMSIWTQIRKPLERGRAK